MIIRNIYREIMAKYWLNIYKLVIAVTELYGNAGRKGLRSNQRPNII
jgi:hypothetical protein